MSVIKWWVDAYFDAHRNCNGHTRAMMSMGSGSMMELSRKQKINGKSSTEPEILVEDNSLPQCLRLRYFVERQGYAVEEFDFHHYNISAMLT